MRRYFDLLFLPDFDEDYVVSPNERMGNASADIQLGQGWSLQGLEATVDNSAITGRLFALYDESIKMGMQLGRTALGLPSVVTGGAQGEVPVVSREDLKGTKVNVKVTIVRLVAPGLYPILKPKELADFDPNTAAAIDPDYRSRILVPIAPLTNIAFNTYEAIVVEAAPATGDSPLRLQQYVDMGGTQAEAPAPGGKLDGPTLTAVQLSVNALLKHANAPHWEVTLRLQQETVIVDMQRIGTGAPAETEDEVVETVKRQLSKRGLTPQVMRGKVS